MRDTPEAWIARRPESVRKLAERYPPMTRVKFSDGTMTWVIGYDEYSDGSAGLKLAPCDPLIDYDKAVMEAQTVCPDCIEAAT